MRHSGRGGVFPAVFACLVLLAGCDNRMWWEYRDDPYMADIAKKGEAEVLRGVNAAKPEERQMALRMLATRASEARREGRPEEAREMETVIIRRYFVEKDQVVRACIVRICATTVGRGSTAMVKFLRERIAAGEFPGYAALSLASLGPRDAFLDIEPLARHPAPEVRYQAAEALAILGDPRGYEPVAKVWRSMQGSLWPDRIDGVPMPDAKRSLELRAMRVFGKPLT